MSDPGWAVPGVPRPVVAGGSVLFAAGEGGSCPAGSEVSGAGSGPGAGAGPGRREAAAAEGPAAGQCVVADGRVGRRVREAGGHRRLRPAPTAARRTAARRTARAGRLRAGRLRAGRLRAGWLRAGWRRGVRCGRRSSRFFFRLRFFFCLRFFFRLRFFFVVRFRFFFVVRFRFSAGPGSSSALRFLFFFPLFVVG